MDDLPESDIYLETPQRENKDLAVLKAIIQDNSCDVATQTFRVSSDNSTQPVLPAGHNVKINERISHVISPCSRSKKSSFRLFIVPDDPESDALRLSFDEENRENNDQSLRFSVISNEWKNENKTQEFLPDYKSSEKLQRSRNALNHKQFYRKDKDVISSVRFEKTDRGITIDHQLRHSTNSSVLAWLRLKNFEEREKRKSKKREKKEARRKVYEEAEKRQKRIQESERRYAQWLAAKKKEARRAWRVRRARNRVDIAEKEDTIQTFNDSPPIYTVVPSFNGVQAWTEDEVSLNTKTRKIIDAQTTSGQIPTASDVVSRHETNDCHINIAELTQSLEAGLNNKHELSVDGDEIKDEASHLANSDKCNDANNNHTRPAIADSKLLPVRGKSSKRSRNIYEKWQAQDSYKRPSTSAVRLTSTKDTMDNQKIGVNHETWLMQKQKEHKSKRAATAKALQVDHKCDKIPFKKSITFEAWKAKKRQEDKEKAEEKKREVVDEVLTETILKMARKRMENSTREKRQLDTGMPKWQARNRVRSSTREKNPDVTSSSSSRYTVIQLLRNENDDHGSPTTTNQSKEITTVRKSCENLKLD